MTVVVAPDQPFSTSASIVASSSRAWVTRLRSCWDRLVSPTVLTA
jgi:hypothetical protein